MVQAGGGADLPEEPVGPDGQRDLRPERLEGDQPVVLEVPGQIDRSGGPGPELPLDAEFARDRRSQSLQQACRHQHSVTEEVR